MSMKVGQLIEMNDELLNHWIRPTNSETERKPARLTEDEYLQGIPAQRFHDICIELWRKDACPLLGDMASIVLEEYNDLAIDKIVEDAYDAGILTDEDAEDDDEENDDDDE